MTLFSTLNFPSLSSFSFSLCFFFTFLTFPTFLWSFLSSQFLLLPLSSPLSLSRFPPFPDSMTFSSPATFPLPLPACGPCCHLSPVLLSCPSCLPLSPILGLSLLLVGLYSWDPRLEGAQALGRMPALLLCSRVAGSLEPPLPGLPPPTLCSGPANTLCFGPTAAVAGGLAGGSLQTQRGGSPSISLVTVLKCIPAGDPNSRRSFAWSEDRGPRRTVRSAASAATREAMLNALARGDSGLRASIGARAAWPAPPPTACTQAHRGRPSPRDPGAGACGATHSLRPWAQGIMASRPPTPGWWQWRGPDGWSALGAWGPSVFQAPCPWPLLPGTAVTSALQTTHCSHRCQCSLCPAKPLSSSTDPEWKQLHGERPASASVRETRMDHRGAAWFQPCSCPPPLPPPPPWLPLHLGGERAVRAPSTGHGRTTPELWRRPSLSAAE